MAFDPKRAWVAGGKTAASACIRRSSQVARDSRSVQSVKRRDYEVELRIFFRAALSNTLTPSAILFERVRGCGAIRVVPIRTSTSTERKRGQRGRQQRSHVCEITVCACEPSLDSGPSNRFDGARSEVQLLPAAVTKRNTCVRWLAARPNLEEAARGCHENRQRTQRVRGNHQANPALSRRVLRNGSWSM